MAELAYMGLTLLSSISRLKLLTHRKRMQKQDHNLVWNTNRKELE